MTTPRATGQCRFSLGEKVRIRVRSTFEGRVGEIINVDNYYGERTWYQVALPGTNITHTPWFQEHELDTAPREEA